MQEKELTPDDIAKLLAKREYMKSKRVRVNPGATLNAYRENRNKKNRAAKAARKKNR